MYRAVWLLEQCFSLARTNACCLTSSPTAYCCRPTSFSHQSQTSSNSSNSRSVYFAGSKRCCPLAALSWNVLPVGECALCSPVSRSRASDWPLRLPLYTLPSCLGAGLRVMERVTRGRVKKCRCGCSGARVVLCAALVVPVLACAVRLTFVCSLWQPSNLPSFAAVQFYRILVYRRRNAGNCPPYYIYCF
jgi:hypothetical protein